MVNGGVMATEEEWRRIGYQRWVGESGNNSMGTIHNQQGYSNYQAQRAAQSSFRNAGFTGTTYTPVYTPKVGKSASGSPPTVPVRAYSPGSERLQTVFTKGSRIVFGIIAVLILAGGVAGYVYAQGLAHATYPSWVFAALGATAGGAIVPLLIALIGVAVGILEALIELVAELIAVAVRLAVVAGLVYVAYQVYQNMH
jgi:hypothetical protein